jgi:mutator protein MutT
LSRVAVFGVLIRGESVLLVKRAATRAYYPGVWDFPGGHVEAGETPERTLVRELEEELGVVPVRFEELPSRSLTIEGLILHGYWVKQWTGTPSNLQEDEHSRIAWIRLSEVDKLELASSMMPELLQAIRM